LQSQPVRKAPPREPSARCSRYSCSTLAKFSLTSSDGIMSEPALPSLYEPTSTWVKVYLRYSCCSLPALRQVSTTFGMCSPLAQASSSFGLALLTLAVKWKSCRSTLPAPPPPPKSIVPSWMAPQLHATTSISPLCLASCDSPSIPSIFRKQSIAALVGLRG